MGGGLGGGVGGGPWALWSLARLSFAGEEAWDPETVGFLLLGGTATCGDHNHNYNDAELWKTTYGYFTRTSAGLIKGRLLCPP